MESNPHLDRLRGRVGGRIAANTLLIEPTPGAGNGDDREGAQRTECGESLGAFADGVGERVERALPEVAHGLPGKIAEVHLGIPGLVGDAAELATAKDKKRAAAGIVGAEVGGALGAAIPIAEIVTGPAGAVAGNWVGHYVYDHRQQYIDAANRI